MVCYPVFWAFSWGRRGIWVPAEASRLTPMNFLVSAVDESGSLKCGSPRSPSHWSPPVAALSLLSQGLFSLFLAWLGWAGSSSKSLRPFQGHIHSHTRTYLL